MIRATFLFLLFLFQHPAAPSRQAKHDLVIEEIVLDIVVYTPPPPKPGEPRRAMCDLKFVLTTVNISGVEP